MLSTRTIMGRLSRSNVTASAVRNLRVLPAVFVATSERVLRRIDIQQSLSTVEDSREGKGEGRWRGRGPDLTAVKPKGDVRFGQQTRVLPVSVLEEDAERRSVDLFLISLAILPLVTSPAL